MGRKTNQCLETTPEKIELINPENIQFFFCWVVDNAKNKFFTEVNKRDIMMFQNYALQQGCSASRVRHLKAALSSISNFIENILDDEYRDSIVEISDRFDDIVLFSDMVTSPKKVSQLDCHHAIIGLEEQPNQYNVVAIPNSVIGEATNRQSFKVDLPEEEPTSPAQEKVKSALMTVSAIITIGILIWYFLFR